MEGGSWKVDNMKIVTVVSVFLTNENPLQVSSANMVADWRGVAMASVLQ
jgi:hypothetical protein